MKRRPTSSYYTRLNKAGDEFFILGPESNQDYLEAGTLQVTSEGRTPKAAVSVRVAAATP